ncbi:MAG: DNA polymerase III subunit chi [Cellvibrionales bacterium]|nr:DNA polymerase III subunit chi [Cellvibrionales bacterium]
MTRIDFYILQGGGPAAAQQLACKLAAKAHQEGTLYLHCADRTQASLLDDLLWTFRPWGFIPHQLTETATPDPKPAESVVIGWQSPPAPLKDTLINLAATPPTGFARFTRLLEIVPAHHEALQQSRKKWRHYQQRGHPLNAHKINP